jgi:hypothetical protein
MMAGLKQIPNKSFRKALEAAGWKVGDAADFLDMNDAERQVLDARVKLALAVRRQRAAVKDAAAKSKKGKSVRKSPRNTLIVETCVSK